MFSGTRNCGGVPDSGNCNAQIVQQPLDESNLDTHYADFLSRFIGDHAAGSGAAPFFAYMAFSHTHVPLFFDPPPLLALSESLLPPFFDPPPLLGLLSSESLPLFFESSCLLALLSS